MQEDILGSRPNEPEKTIVGKLAVAEDVSLALATALASLNIVGWLTPAAAVFRAGWSAMAGTAAIMALLTAISLYFSRPRHRRRTRKLAVALAALVAVGSAFVFAANPIHPLPAMSFAWSSGLAHVMAPLASTGFVLASIATALIPLRGKLAGIIADFIIFCLLFLVAVLVSAHALGKLSVFGPVTSFATSGQTLLCLALLTAVIFIRRAQNGVFSILLKRGIGSKVARILAPLLLLLPYLREALRARLIGVQRMPPHFTTALLATAAMCVSMALLMYLAWRLNALEVEIHELSLRDALTGLYNLRGFRLLAHQSLLLARRSGKPFSVLFIDVDNLKQVNDSLGHDTGSRLLVVTAEILRQTFRETDVLARIGGDEFAMAGEFSRSGIAEAVRRLRQAAGQQSGEQHFPLGFSVGWVTSDCDKHHSLADLLAMADQEMYSEKRGRKAPPEPEAAGKPEASLPEPCAPSETGATRI